MLQPTSGNVKVVCRFRPFNQRQKALGISSFYQVSSDKSVLVKEQRSQKIETLNFNFDKVFDQNSKQSEVYDYTARSVVDSVLEGFNGTIFAYGQTSSGKTFTMQGLSLDGELAGVIPRMIRHVFESINNGPEAIEFLIKVSIVELYNQKIRDLLDNSKTDLKIRSDKVRGIHLENVTQNYISEPEQVFGFLKLAQQNRAISATNMNENSSRSHMLFILTINQNNTEDLSAKTGKLYLVDLAGSEKVSKTGAQGKVLEEAKKINMSLTTLGKVINTLTDGKSTHIPYRDSKLTRMLQESLGGNSKTALIVTCSPHSYNISETISTLRFGVSAKNIKNKPKINRQMTVAQLQQLLEKSEIKVMEKQKHIQRLEEYIKNDLKGKIPVFNESTANTEVLDDAEDEKLKALQSDLEIQRHNASMNHQQLIILRKDYALLQQKLEAMQKQNESLLQKIIKLEVNQNVNKEVPSGSFFTTNLLQKIANITTDPEVKKLIQSQTLSASGQSELESSNLVKQLRQSYEQEKQKRKKAEEQLLRNDKDVKKKLTSLQNNIQQLTSVYHDLYVEQSKWKIENTINLRRLQKKQNQIMSLENTISDLKEELARKKDVDSQNNDSSFDEEEMIKQRQINSLKRFAHSRLVKPVKGGNKHKQ